MKTLRLRISILWLLLLGLAPRAWPLQAVLEQILDNGPRDNRINIVFLAEGFTENELDGFVYHARNHLGRLLTTPPFDEYRNYFNGFVIRVASAESGSDHPAANIYRDTYFNSSYDNSGYGRLMEIPPNSYDGDAGNGQSKVRTLLKRFSLDYAIPIMLVNDTEYGGSGDGSGRAVTVVPLNYSGLRIMLHELGHALAALGDEYVEEPIPYWGPERPNTTREFSRDFVRWRNWIDNSTPIPTPAIAQYANKVGLFEGAEYAAHGWYRPQSDCTMNHIESDFCAVCSEALVLAIHDRVRQVDEFTPGFSSFRITRGDSVRFGVTLLSSASHPVKIQWLVDKKPVPGANSPEFTLNTAPLANGAHSVTAVVHDDTPLVRTDPDERLKTKQVWTVEVADDTPQLTARPVGLRGLLLKFVGPAGRRVVIESSENLIDWRVVADLANATGVLEVMDSFGNVGLKRFYRAQVLEL